MKKLLWLIICIIMAYVMWPYHWGLGVVWVAMAVLIPGMVDK